MTTYTLATEQDDPLLRELLRENAMPSWVSMTMEREPSYFAGMNRFGLDWVVLARQDDRPVGMYACSEQPVHLNGLATELGYLGGLRIPASQRHRVRLFREGCASIRSFSRPRNPELWYTSIASGNRVARRFLEANLRGMPHYWPVNELVTLALPAARAQSRLLWRAARPEEMQALCALHNTSAARFQFSPVLTPQLCSATGADFHVVEQRGALVACMALWNQQSYKQIVARAYRAPLARLVPFYNLYARWSRKVELPRPGQALEQTCLAFLAVSPQLEQGICALIQDALKHCTTPVLTLGLHDQHPWLDKLTRTFRPLSYRTRIYAVNFDGPIALDGRAAQPEAAVL